MERPGPFEIELGLETQLVRRWQTRPSFGWTYCAKSLCGSKIADARVMAYITAGKCRNAATPVGF